MLFEKRKNSVGRKLEYLSKRDLREKENSYRAHDFRNHQRESSHQLSPRHHFGVTTSSRFLNFECHEAPGLENWNFSFL